MDGHVVIAGGSGFIGKALEQSLVSQGRTVFVLTRSEPRREIEVQWDTHSVGKWKSALDGASAIVNLCGAPIVHRWTTRYRETLLRSRVDSIRAIGDAIRSVERPPKTWLNASAIGYYGDRGDEELDEASSKGQGFISDLCAQWEEATLGQDTPGTIKTVVRIGVVLGSGGGALPVLAKLSRLHLGGHVGNGEQVVSWIHIDDLIRMVSWLIDKPIEGVINATAPHPVTNHALMSGLAESLDRRAWPAVPVFAVKLLGALGGPPPSLSLEGQNVIPWRAMENGFPFQYADLEPALASLLPKL